jgi:hypothetical protein
MSLLLLGAGSSGPGGGGPPAPTFPLGTDQLLAWGAARKEAAPGSYPAAGTAFTGWTDFSGHNNGPVQADADKQGVWLSDPGDLVNGHPGIYLNGNKYYRLPALSQGDIAGRVVLTICCREMGAGNSRNIFDAADDSYRHVFYYHVGNAKVYAFENGTQIQGEQVAGWGPAVFAVAWDGANSKIWKNGVIIASGEIGVVDLRGFTLAAASDQTSALVGAVYEFTLHAGAGFDDTLVEENMALLMGEYNL